METKTHNPSHEGNEINKLKAIIQQTNPAITTDEQMVCDCGHLKHRHRSYREFGKDCELCKCQNFLAVKGRPIRLADVLLAIQEFVGDLRDSDNGVSARALDVLLLWNLSDDALDHQSDECKEFLIGLLVNE